MKLLFKQRFFSWFDSYDIFDESGNTIFTVKGELSWGHLMNIYNAQGQLLGTVKEEIFTFLPRFELIINNECIGEITKEFTLFRSQFTLNCNDWEVNGDWLGWDYSVTNSQNSEVMHASKELWNFTDTYTIDVTHPEDALLSLMVVLAIDAVNCSQNN